MIFRPSGLAGCVVVEQERRADERGFFARTFSASEFDAHGLSPHVAECSVSRNDRVGTLRGMHFQAPPHEEAKLVRCTRGRLFDVAVDLRPSSTTRWRWFSVELTEDNGLALYVPEGMAHGFLTLEPGTEVTYQISTGYVLDAAQGVRFDDPLIGIDWPDVGTLTISERDRNWPSLDEAGNLR